MWNSLWRGSPASGDSWKMDPGASMFCHNNWCAIKIAHQWLHQMETFPSNWPFVRGIHRSPVNSPHKGHLRGALMFSLICVWINEWVNNLETGDLIRYRAHYDVIVMWRATMPLIRRDKLAPHLCREMTYIWCKNIPNFLQIFGTKRLTETSQFNHLVGVRSQYWRRQ